MSATTTTTIPNEDEVLRRIEQAVLDHRLAPGTKLKEVQLANLFGVKRGLIRKVLTRLAHSRLVEQTPNRGATVASPSVKEGQDLFAARRAIESAILETLIARIEDSELAPIARQVATRATGLPAGRLGTGARPVGQFSSRTGAHGR